MEFFHKVPRIHFMASRKWCYAFSAVLIIASIVALIRPGLNYGIDFTGGVAVLGNATSTATPSARTGPAEVSRVTRAWTPNQRESPPRRRTRSAACRCWPSSSTRPICASSRGRSSGCTHARGVAVSIQAPHGRE